MINHLKTTMRFRNSKNGFKHFFNSFRSINMKWRFSSQKPETRNQSGQTETVVTMKVRNKDMVDFRKSCFCLSQLNLSSFSTIDEKTPFFHLKKLRSWRRIHRGNCRIVAENGKISTQYYWWMIIDKWFWKLQIYGIICFKN